MLVCPLLPDIGLELRIQILTNNKPDCKVEADEMSYANPSVQSPELWLIKLLLGQYRLVL
jgi:hypothetical protein